MSKSFSLKYQDFKSIVQLSLRNGLPGEEAQYSIAPKSRSRLSSLDLDPKKVKKAGVLALIENRDGLAQLLLTERTIYPGAHSGQISFPGGRYEDIDENFRQTAIRETQEEVGLAADAYTILSPLTELYIPPSNFLVHPFLALADNATDLKREEKEVAKIHRIPFSEFLNEMNIKETSVNVTGGFKIKTKAFLINDLTIWGATAMIISEIRALVLNS